MRHLKESRFAPYLLLMLLASISGICLSPAPAAAATKYGNSLDLIPADAAFFSTSLRLREQVDIIAKSNAWSKLVNMPSVQMAWSLAQLTLNQPGGPGDQIAEFFADPDNKELRDMAIDAVSHEIFVYGDPNAADFCDIALRTVNAVQYGSMVADVQDDENVSARIVLNSLDANRERLNAPGLIIGFKVTDTQRAQGQLARLEKIAKPILDEEPKFRGRLKRMTVGDTDVLTLDLDGSMVPWDEVPWGDLAEKPGQYDALKEKLAKMRVTVSLAIQDSYLLLVIGDSPVRLAALGKGKLLAEMPEAKSLEKFASERLTHVSYISKAMLQAMTNTSRDLDQLVQVVRQVLPEAGLPEDLNQRILTDAEELAGDLKGVVPEPGAEFSFSFLTPQGIEGYRYDWTQNQYMDGSKPLSLLEHVGGSPLLAALGRSKYSPQQYEGFRKWMIKAFGYFEELAIPQFSDEEQQHYKKVKEAALPLVERLDKATSQMLLPALADGQAAIVLDAKLTSKQWFEGFPQNGRALPMLEVGLVFGVSDAALLKQACTEYRDVIETAIEKAKQLFPEDVPPDFKLPQPETSQVNAGGPATRWSYKLPSEAGVNSQLMPNAGLSNQVAVLSLSPKSTERLLGSTPLVVTPNGPLSDRSKPLAGAVYFNWAGLIDAAKPWVDVAAAQIAHSEGGDAAADNGPGKMVMDQVHTVLDVLKALHTVECATYLEDKATVTHSLAVIQDVP